jgi:hypothetical protein
MKKRKLIRKKFEVSEGNECEDGDEESDDEEENDEKAIVSGKIVYDYSKESDEGVFIDDDEIFIDESEIYTTSEFHYQTGRSALLSCRGWKMSM